MRLFRRHLTCLVAAGVLVTGCWSGSAQVARAATSSGSEAEGVTLTAMPASPALLVPSEKCTSVGWSELPLVATDWSAVPFLISMSACRNAGWTATWVQNDSKAVWTIRAPLQARIDQQTPGDRLGSFRLIAPSIDTAELLLPGTTVLIWAAPRDVSWTLSPGLTAAWLAHNKVIDTVETRMRADAVHLFAQGSKRRAALIECTLEAAEIGTGVLTKEDATDGLIQNLASGVRDCAKTWRAADEAAIRAEGRTPPRRWVFPARSWGQSPAFVRQADSLLADVLTFAGRVVRGR